MNPSIPAARQAASRSPGLPASQTCSAPARFSACAKLSACASYAASAPHRHASLDPLAAKRAADCSALAAPESADVARPPASNNSRAKPTRRAGADPIAATKTLGRAPVRARASATSRSRSNGSETRIGASAGATISPANSTAGAVAGSTLAASSARSGWALTPVIGVFNRAASRVSAALACPTFAWNAPARRAFGKPPPASISWNSAHAASHKPSVSASNAPAPAAGSATKPRCDSRSWIDCVLRASLRASESGKPIACVNGRMLMLSAPPRPAEKAPKALRITFTYGSRALIMRQALSACRRAAASLGDPRPEQTERPKLGERDEFVGVRRHAELDPRARLLEGKSALLERPQIAHARGEREGELLPGRAARRVRRPPVGGEERPAKPLAFQRCDEPGERSRLLVPPRPASATPQAAERIEAEAETDILEARARPRDEPGKASRLRLGLRPEVQFETRAFVETDPVECAMQRSGIPFAQAIAVRSGGAGEDDLQPVRAVGEVLERLRVRVPGLGVIHARQDRKSV